MQNEIEAVQENLLAVDQKVDELEGDVAPTTGAEGVDADALVAPTIDLAQVVGRLEAEVAQCRQEIAELRSSTSQAEALAEAALEVATAEPMEEETDVPEIVEVAPEPEPQPSGEEGQTNRNPNWLEKFLLVR